MLIGHLPHPDYYRSLARLNKLPVGRKVEHRTNRYLNNRVEQDHRAVVPRYYPMRGFRAFDSAARFCTAFDEVRQYFRSRTSSQKKLPVPEQRRQFQQRFEALFAAFLPA